MQFYFAELNCCYMPGMLFYLDRNYHEFNDWFKRDAQEEAVGVRARARAVRHGRRRAGAQMGNVFPLERFIWGSDFPHSVGTFPNSREVRRRNLRRGRGISAAQDPLENICKHLGLDPTARITETPAA